MFLVTDGSDTVDANPGDGIAADALGNTTLRAAIMEANALDGPDTVRLMPMTYSLSLTGTGEDASATGDLDITDEEGLTIDVFNFGSATIDANSIDRIFDLHDGAGLDLSGATLTGGAVTGDGGAIRNIGGTLSFTDCEITGNSATGDGGAIYDYDGTVVLTACEINDNSATSQGGGIYGRISSLTVIDTTFSDNTANSGGAIEAYSLALTISGSTFSDNSASSGGAIYAQYSSTTIADSAFLRNSATSGHGGVVYMHSGTLSAVDSTFLGNSANSYGGVLCAFASSSTVRLTNSVLVGNSASNGGGIYGGCNLTLTHSTVAWNTASATGGGISAGNTTIRNSIVALNSAPASSQIVGSYTSDNSLVGIDPLFTTDPSPGTDGVWGTADDPGDLTLLPESPAIDLGNDLFLDEVDSDAAGPDAAIDLDGSEALGDYVITADLNGAPRTYGNAADAGAYELQANPASGRETPSAIVTANDDEFDLYDGDITLREAAWYVSTGSVTGNTVTLASALDGATITLHGVQLFLDGELTIDASALASLTVDGDDLSRVFSVAADAEVTLSGLTVTGGGITNYGLLSLNESSLVNNVTTGSGGAIHNVSGTLSLTNCELSGNSASNGGAVFSQGTIDLLSCQLHDNSATNDGGALYNNHGTLTLAGSQLAANSAEYDGGAIYSNEGTIALASCEFSGNSALDEGGAIRSLNGPITAADSAFSENSATRGGAINGLCSHIVIAESTFADNSAGGGGAIEYAYGSMIINACEFVRNQATTYSGGAISHDYAGPLVVLDSSFTGNAAASSGGAIGCSMGAGATVTNSRIVGNSAEYGGAISGGVLTITSSTIAGNTASTSAGGIWTSDTATIKNSIVALNSVPASPQVAGSSVALDPAPASPQLAGSCTSENSLVDVDPLFIRDPSPGDDGVYGTSDDDYGNVTLQPGSPAIDMGNNLFLDEIDSDADGPDTVIDLDGSGTIGDYAIHYDLAGFSRVYGARTDMGVYETHPIVVETTDGNDVVVITLGVAGVSSHQVRVNRTVTLYDPESFAQVHILGGEGADRITICGTNADETALFDSEGVQFSQAGAFDISATGFETVTIDSGEGDDAATLIGSDGANQLRSYAGYTTLTDSTRSFSYRVEGFEDVSVEAPGDGRDCAFLYGSAGNDGLDADPDGVVLERDADGETASTVSAAGFQTVYAYGMSGGNDWATLTGSDTNMNRFYSYTSHSILTDSQRSFYFYANGFEDVSADSPSSARSYAYLYDSAGDDTLTATPTSATMDRAEGWSDATAAGFERLYIYATRGGDDTAGLTGNSNGGNRYTGRPSYSTLTDSSSSFYHYVRGFSSVTATGSETATCLDRAYLYDSSGDDSFVGQGSSTVLEDAAGSVYHNEALYFDLVYARSTDSSTREDTAKTEDLDYRLWLIGTW